MSMPKPSYTPLSRSPSWDTITQSLPIITTVALAVVALISFAITSNRSKIPLANPPGRFQTTLSRRLEFLTNGLKVVENARKRYGNEPYRLITDVGEVLVLPPAYAQTIRNEKSLNFGKTFEQDMHGYLPGYQPFSTLIDERKVIQQVIKKQLTKHLNYVSEPLSTETTFALDVIFGKSPEWKETVITEDMLNLVSRLSSKIFLGDKLCRNEDWIEKSKEYVVASTSSTKTFHAWPKPLHFLIPWISKDAKFTQQKLNEVRAILEPILRERKNMKAEAKKRGKPAPVFEDTLEWFEEETQGVGYDPAVFQMIFTIAAIHTTSSLLSQVIMRLANGPHLIDELREEIVSVLRADGLTKASTANLKLMDSAIKETQRIKPMQQLSMRRFAEKKIVLPDGLTINRGDRVAVDSHRMLDPEVYPDPEKFDIHRYLRIRETNDNATKALLVTTSPENLTFGHGLHACPGRFFAAIEVKITLCHMLLKYDWELVSGANLNPFIISADETTLDPSNRVRFRRRKEEIDLGSLAYK